ncbi:MAG: type II secretion system protein [Patescibacteria group bacterium]|nr:type II secretion system protein [Patescibacteria group bacterium]
MKKFGFKRGFTLIELLVVVAIIGVLAAVVLATLNSARNKGGDAAVKANLKNAVTQGEVIYSTRTANTSTYTGACTTGVIAGETVITGVGGLVLAAAKANGLASYTTNGTGTLATATCNDSASAWAAEVPLKAVSGMWCSDSTGKSKQEAGTIGAGTVCA